MSTAPATAEDADAGDVAAAVRSAPFVRVVAAADGDSLAASGVLARALRALDVPFQVRVEAFPDPASVLGDADDLVLGVGSGEAGADLALGTGVDPASAAAAAAARELGVDPDPVLALAGVAAAGRPLGAGDAAWLLEAAGERTRVERRPGVATPTADLADGLAHSTLVHAPCSGDPEAARAALDRLAVPADPSDDDRRRLASWLAVEATGSADRAATAVERALRPHATPDGRFATVEGFGDALDAVARERPGTGVALAIRDDEDVRTAALDAWRTHARSVHDSLAAGTTSRYDGVFVLRVDDDASRLPTLARLCRDFRSPEPVACVVADRAAAATATVDAGLGGIMRTAVRNLDAEGTSAGGTRRAVARFDDAFEVSRLITTFREAL